jgi:Protein of unknown function (DUF3105)
MRRLPLFLLLSVGLIAACGGDSGSGGITVNFVGNSTCPTSGQSPYSPSPPNTNSAPVGKAIDEMPHLHVAQGTPVTYNHNPPTSGCHYNLGFGVAPIKPGVYPPPNAKLTPEYWVHNLEHGYVVVSYNCASGCLADLEALNTWYHTLPPDGAGVVPYAKFIAIPDPAQKDKWDVESWDWFDALGSTFNLNEIKKFYANHTNQAPEGPGSV